MKALGLGWDQVHAEAERLEHYLSEELESRDRRGARLPDPRPARRSDPNRRARARARGGPMAERRRRRRPRRSSAGCPTATLSCCGTSASLGIVPDQAVVLVGRAPFDGPRDSRDGGGCATRSDWRWPDASRSRGAPREGDPPPSARRRARSSRRLRSRRWRSTDAYGADTHTMDGHLMSPPTWRACTPR